MNKRQEIKLAFTIECSITSQEVNSGGDFVEIFHFAIKCGEKVIWEKDFREDFFLTNEKFRYFKQYLEQDLADAAIQSAILAELFAEKKAASLNGENKSSELNEIIEDSLKNRLNKLKKRFEIETRGKKSEYQIDAYALQRTYKAYFDFYDLAKELNDATRIKQTLPDLHDDLIDRLLNSKSYVFKENDELQNDNYPNSIESIALIHTARIFEIKLSPQPDGISSRQLRRMMKNNSLSDTSSEI